ncbi:hypothetical protein ACFOTA_02970 [Chitinophaga sp. GCM10012297]|uniref:Outer membrane lipoprotein-sorting protein n=1 Tax=Chitinophaga chungangae TaxID=2821488 RepID=A0ABS3Y8Z3_9BACT|nr:hypothetical protein [Chitinophaga chungangae]MBO9151153.1 hypothetical protein [Chitinophaga chungangae]
MIVLSALGAGAQQVDTSRLFREITEVQAMFRDKELAFDMRYTYADESRPLAIIDSAKGKMEMTKAGSRYELSNVVCVNNNRYVIVLFKDDKLMYLSKAFFMTPADPFQQMRAMIGQGSVRKFSVEKTADGKKLQLEFDPQGPCRKIELETNPVDGVVKKIRYTIRTEMIRGGSLGQISTEHAGDFGEHVVVSMYFEKYRKPEWSAAQFDEKNFFFREGEELKTTAAYQDYTIFKASTNL